MRIRQQYMDDERISWEVWSFESDTKSAIEQAEGWEEMGHKWSGRDTFLKGQGENE